MITVSEEAQERIIGVIENCGVNYQARQVMLTSTLDSCPNPVGYIDSVRQLVRRKLADGIAKDVEVEERIDLNMDAKFYEASAVVMTKAELAELMRVVYEEGYKAGVGDDQLERT